MGQKTPEIHPQILKNLKYNSFIGYTINPGMSRVTEGYIDHKTWLAYVEHIKQTGSPPELELVKYETHY